MQPLRDYHKDEVRELGTSLGLADSLVWRQPFPGPGLAIRIICALTPFLDDSFFKTNSILQWIVQKGKGSVSVNATMLDSDNNNVTTSVNQEQLQIDVNEEAKKTMES